MSIETQAVAEITKILNLCPRLEAVLDTYDRVPLTDGHIDVYSSNKHSKSTWRKRVPVQVKGRSSDRKNKPRPSFPIERVELEAHQDNGGVLLFCVDINLMIDKCMPQYAILKPYDIRRILASIPDDQKSVSIRLTPLPRVPESVERIVNVALVGTRQNSFLHTNPHVFESATHITITTVDVVDFAKPVILDPGEAAFALEVTTATGDRIPIDGGLEIVPGDYVEQDCEMRVAAGNAVFEHIKVQRLSPAETRVTLGDGLSLVVHEGDSRHRASINITYPGNFAARKRALEFAIGIAESRKIMLGERSLDIGDLTENDTRQVDEMREHLQYLRRFQAVFDKFDADGSLVDMDSLTDAHIENLRVLYGVFIEGVPAGNPHGKPGRTLVNFGQWAVMLVVVPGEEPGTWRYLDPFDPETPQMFRWSTDDQREITIPITAYDAVEAEHLPKVLNLRLATIDTAYERIAHGRHTAEIANERVRDLVTCADVSPLRRAEFLRGADRLNEWIIRQQGEVPVHLLNRWQIAWRTGALTDADQADIRRLKHELARSDDVRAGQQELACALLLEDVQEIKFLTEQLTPEHRSEMESWPMWELHRKLLRK